MPDLKDYQKSKNIAEMLTEDKLAEIGSQVVEGYLLDKESRFEWEQLMTKVLKIVKQTVEPKSGPNRANVKFPLITKGGIEFASRLLSEVIQGNRVVLGTVIGQDPNNEIHERAARISKHMSYQLLEESDDWLDGMDRLFHMLPVYGTMFKKVYYDPILKINRSEVINPDRIIVDNNISSLESASRITHVLYMTSNDIIERQRLGLFSDTEIDSLHSPSLDLDFDRLRRESNESREIVNFQDDNPLYELLEQHCFIDLDGDGYKEPYIVTVHKDSRKILRIVNRFHKIVKENGKLMRIVPENFFVDYHFLKSSDGSFYSIGLGRLLFHINHSINTLINQLIDSGTLNNQYTGLMGRGARLKGGEIVVRPGSINILDAAPGAVVKDNLIMLPTKEPSGTLFQLLGMLIEIGKDLSNVTDVLQGKQPAQNVPATTILTLTEQGLKLFNSIASRVLRSLKKEFRRLFRLNQKYLTNEAYRSVLNNMMAFKEKDYGLEDADFREIDVIPVADPNLSSDAQRLARARSLLELPTINRQMATKYLLEALQFPKEQIEELLSVAPEAQGPSDAQIKAEVELQKLQVKVQEMEQNMMLKMQEMELKAMSQATLDEESQARIVKMMEDAAHGQQRADNESLKIQQKHMSDMMKTATAKQTLNTKESEIQSKERIAQDKLFKS